jgi:hypothetical protein
MIRIKIKATGEIKSVTNNEAFDLIDRKLAEVYKEYVQKPQPFYSTRQLRARRR